eukprot:533884-Lingulodinium_polyedra.AAC.1
MAKFDDEPAAVQEVPKGPATLPEAEPGEETVAAPYILAYTHGRRFARLHRAGGRWRTARLAFLD